MNTLLKTYPSDLSLAEWQLIIPVLATSLTQPRVRLVARIPQNLVCGAGVREIKFKISNDSFDIYTHR